MSADDKPKAKWIAGQFSPFVASVFDLGVMPFSPSPVRNFSKALEVKIPRPEVFRSIFDASGFPERSPSPISTWSTPVAGVILGSSVFDGRGPKTAAEPSESWQMAWKPSNPLPTITEEEGIPTVPQELSADAEATPRHAALPEPAIAEFLLDFFLSSAHAEEVRGDIAEQYTKKSAKLRPFALWVWYWKEIGSALVRHNGWIGGILRMVLEHFQNGS
jgi:hypothetical protein